MRRNGPVAAPSSHIARVGWEQQSHGMAVDRYGPFSLQQISWQEVVHRLTVAWPQALAVSVFHRTTMDGIEQADVAQVQAKLKTYRDADQAFVRCMLDGALFTQGAKAKLKADVSSNCVFCQKAYGFEHRMWHCPYFQDCRAQVTEDEREAIQRMPPCRKFHGWLLHLASVHSPSSSRHVPLPD